MATSLRTSHLAFTLPELLITLLILGEIATFTIPKIIAGQQLTKYNAMSKEAAAMMTGAFTQYNMATGISASTSMGDLTQYINYVSVDATSTVDHFVGQGSISCASYTCLKLHNGATLIYDPTKSFGAVNSTSIIRFWIDPDGVYSGGTTGDSKSQCFFIISNGRMGDWGSYTASPTFTSSGVSFIATPTANPPWFSW